jgi:hypothetical protein
MMVLPSATATLEIDARLDSMRGAQVDAHGALLPSDTAVWRAAVDGDDSGNVSNEEVGVFVSVFDELIDTPDMGVLEAYNFTWLRENASGAHRFTVDGRAALAQFAFERAPNFRFAATFDGLNGTLDRVETTFTNLTGSTRGNATIELRAVAMFSWLLPDFSKDVHRLDLFLPPVVYMNLTVGGDIEIVSFENVLDGRIASGRAAASGRTTEYSAVFYVRERHVSSAAYTVALAAILAPMALVAFVALVSSPRHAVKETPPPVEPRYK